MDSKSVILPIIIFLFYIVLVNRYDLYNRILDKVVSIIFILYYSTIDLKYGFLACFAMILYNIKCSNYISEGLEIITDLDESPQTEPYDSTNDSTNIKNKQGVELVVARYNENLNWLNRRPFNNYDVSIYNKGPNDNFTVNNKNIRVTKLSNLGKCDHTYLYHIIKNYDNLSDVTVFLPGSLNMRPKMKKARQILHELDMQKRTVFIGQHMADVKRDLYNFKLDEWKTSSTENFNQNPESKLMLASPRPFGKWYESKFGDIAIQHVSYGGIMAISKAHILQHPKKYYENLIQDLDKSSNPEAGHYFERAWAAVFYPMTGAKYINGEM